MLHFDVAIETIGHLRRYVGLMHLDFAVEGLLAVGAGIGLGLGGVLVGLDILPLGQQAGLIVAGAASFFVYGPAAADVIRVAAPTRYFPIDQYLMSDRMIPGRLDRLLWQHVAHQAAGTVGVEHLLVEVAQEAGLCIRGEVGPARAALVACCTLELLAVRQLSQMFFVRERAKRVGRRLRLFAGRIAIELRKDQRLRLEALNRMAIGRRAGCTVDVSAQSAATEGTGHIARQLRQPLQFRSN